MKVTAQSDYAIRAVFDLAYHGGGKSVRAEEVAARQQISQRFLEQTFGKLAKAGLVGGTRGPKGGYRLLREARKITFHDVISAIEGPVELVFCISKEPSGERCGREESCAARLVWGDVSGKIAEVFRETTIEDICRRAEEAGIPRESDSRLMYYI